MELTEKECLRRVANRQVDNYNIEIREAALKYLMRECLKDKRFTVTTLKVLAEEVSKELKNKHDKNWNTKRTEKLYMKNLYIFLYR